MHKLARLSSLRHDSEINTAFIHRGRQKQNMKVPCSRFNNYNMMMVEWTNFAIPAE